LREKSAAAVVVVVVNPISNLFSFSRDEVSETVFCYHFMHTTTTVIVCEFHAK
jgi:hypothetical protein